MADGVYVGTSTGGADGHNIGIMPRSIYINILYLINSILVMM